MTIAQGTFSQSGTINPAGGAEAITPANADLTRFTRSIYIGGDGNLEVMMAEDQATIVTFIGVVAGTILPLRVSQIRAATTATSIVALY